MEGLTSMAIHFREGFERYAPPVYDQAVAVLSWQVEAKTVRKGLQSDTSSRSDFEELMRCSSLSSCVEIKQVICKNHLNIT
jgi:hypothetical protein